MQRLSRVLIALTASLVPAVAGCDDLALDDAAPVDDGALAITAAPYNTTPTSGYSGGLVRFRLNGSGPWRTGFTMLGPATSEGDTKVIMAADLPYLVVNQCIPDITVEVGFYNSGAHSSTTTARVINYLSRDSGMTALLLDQRVSAVRAPTLASTIPAAQTSMTCTGYNPNNGNLAYMYGRSLGPFEYGYTFHEDTGYAMDGELNGWVCSDSMRTSLFGFASGTRTTALATPNTPAVIEDFQLSTIPLNDWSIGVLRVADFTNPGQLNRPENIASTQNAMCLDIPYGTVQEAPVNQYGCHSGDNQRFYWNGVSVTRNGAAATRWVLQNAHTGMCLANTTSGIRQIGCSRSDTRQMFERVAVSGTGAPAGKVDVRLKIDGASTCLAVSGTTPSTAIVAGSCTSGASIFRVNDPSYLSWCSAFVPWY